MSEFSDFLLRVGEGTEYHNEVKMVHIDEKSILLKLDCCVFVCLFVCVFVCPDCIKEMGE